MSLAIQILKNQITSVSENRIGSDFQFEFFQSVHFDNGNTITVIEEISHCKVFGFSISWFDGQENLEIELSPEGMGLIAELLDKKVREFKKEKGIL